MTQTKKTIGLCNQCGENFASDDKIIGYLCDKTLTRTVPAKDDKPAYDVQEKCRGVVIRHDL